MTNKHGGVASLALLIGASFASAATITFTESATASGLLGSTPFTNSLVTLTATGDTSNVTLRGPRWFVILGVPVAINIASLGTTANLTDVGGVVSCQNNSCPSSSAAVAGFGDITNGNDILDTFNGAFNTYSLTTSIGPLTGSSAINASVTFKTDKGTFQITSAGTATFTATLAPPQAPPSITSGGIVPVDSTVTTIQPGEWVSIYGTNLASSTVIWSGDFPTSLGGTSVAINGKPAFLSLVSPTQINLQAPTDKSVGSVPVVVTTAGGNSTSTVTLAQFAPAFLLLDSKHVAGIILRSNGSGAYGGGTYDILGPTGISLGYPTVAAKAGDTVALFATGLGPTNPGVPAGQAFSGVAPTDYPITLLINNVSVSPAFAGLSGAGLDQINLVVPAGLGTGDVPLVALVATAGGAQTPSNVVISLQ